MEDSAARGRLLAERLLPAGFLALFSLVLLASGLTYSIDVWLLDLRSALMPVGPRPGVAIVEIDAQSLREIGRWPWPRGVHARLIERLREGGAGPIGYEVLFLEPDSAAPEGDAALGDAIRRHGRVVLPMTAEERRLGVLGETFPIERLSDPASAVGHVDRTPDQRSGMFRGLHLYAGIGQPRWPAMPLAMLATGEEGWTHIGAGAEPSQARRPEWVRTDPVLPVFSHPLEGLPRASAAALLSGDFPAERLKGLYVLVGVTAEGLAQRFSTIVSGATTLLSGVELDALVLQSLLYNQWLHALDWGATATLTALLVLGLALVSVQPEARHVLWSTLGAMLILVGLWMFLLTRHLWFPIMPALISIALVLGTRMWLRLQRTEIEAYRDHLTHVANRRRFGQVLEVEWRSAQRSGRPLALILADVDNFKRFNDTYGHDAGDAALVEVSRVLEDSTKRPRDLTARYGGEEFIVLLPETSTADALGVAERIRTNVETLAIPHSGNPPYDVLTLSLGIASHAPQPGESTKDLFNRADEALYAAKHRGRNRAETAGPPTPLAPEGATPSPWA